MIGQCEQLEIDTKDICLLCLGSRVGNSSFDSVPTLRSLQGLKHLLRYLKVSPKELFNCSSEFLQSMEIREDIDLKISLCSKCSTVTEKFNKLYQEYELIQLQFSSCVQSLHESISEGNENPERVRKYKDQMRPTKSSDLVNASIAANLRNETLKKCSFKLQSVSPRVRVATRKPNVNNYPQVLNAGDVESCSVFVNRQVQLLEPKDTLRPEARAFKHPVNFRFGSNSANTKPTNVPQPGSCLAGAGPILRGSTETISDTEVFAEVKRETNINRKTGYFNSIRKKLKTKAQLQYTGATARALANLVSNPARFARRKGKRCEHCEMIYSSKQSLRMHKLVHHAEHFIIKRLPSHVSLARCKQGIHAVWKQMFKENGKKCQFCKIDVARATNLKRHLVNSHLEELATLVSENIQSSPELTDEIMADSNNGNLSTIQGTSNARLPCEYCNLKCTSRATLRKHELRSHPEHIVYKYFPRDIPLESCKQGVEFVLEQILNQDFSFGYICKFCSQNTVRKDGLKRHLVSFHAEQLALEAQQWSGMLPEQLEVSSTDPCSSSLRTYERKRKTSPGEDVNTSNQLSVPVEMDYEEESCIKIENPESDSDEVDPLDVDFMDEQI